MSLFESVESEPGPGQVDKNRLFETLEKEKRGGRDYLKVLGPVVITVLVAGGAVVYFTMPGLGDEVRPPQTLDDTVRAFYRDNEKREVSEATYFYCKDFYSARVVLEKRPDVTARQFDHGNRLATGTEKEKDVWQVSSRVVEPGAEVDPCAR